jgi:hypothetical protein
MSNAGIPLRIIQEISGHNNLEQLQREERGEAGSSQRSDRESFHAFLEGEILCFPPYHSQINQIEDESSHLKPEELACRIF